MEEKNNEAAAEIFGSFAQRLGSHAATISINEPELTTKKEGFSGDDAIVKVVSGNSQYPNKSGKIKGIIHGGGPAPGITVPGEFEASAIKKGNDVYVVTLTEYWNDGKSHRFMIYEVSPTEVKFVEIGGYVSPEMYD